MSYKLTDSEIKNALCEMVERGFETISYADKNKGVNVIAITDIIDLINRQKEFADKLKDEIVNDIHFSQIEKDYLYVMINNLLKEMEGEDK